MEKNQIDDLIAAAAEARKKAYIPYSHYAVGAALLTADGVVYTGCNIENASYTPTVCAERVAMFKAVSEGHRQFIAIAVVTENGVSPCGVCRQVLGEFMLDGVVLMADTEGKLLAQMAVNELLPRAFLQTDLKP